MKNSRRFAALIATIVVFLLASLACQEVPVAHASEAVVEVLQNGTESIEIQFRAGTCSESNVEGQMAINTATGAELCIVGVTDGQCPVGYQEFVDSQVGNFCYYKGTDHSMVVLPAVRYEYPEIDNFKLIPECGLYGFGCNAPNPQISNFVTPLLQPLQQAPAVLPIGVFICDGKPCLADGTLLIGVPPVKKAETTTQRVKIDFLG